MNLDDYEKGMTAARLDEIFSQASLMLFTALLLLNTDHLQCIAGLWRIPFQPLSNNGYARKGVS